MIDFNDLNDIPTLQQRNLNAEREEIRVELIARLEPVLLTMFPDGKKRRGRFFIGDIHGSPGESLEVVLEGEKAGLWTDRATGDGGDIYAIIGGHFGIDVRRDFPAVLNQACDLLGRTRPVPMHKARQQAPVDDLGPATAKWEYLDSDGKLIATVSRFDPPGRRKEFRPWDALKRRASPPDPRPLYNLPGLVHASSVTVVEGEKCAQALIDKHFVATTAMHGANAPVDKTDWSPLAGKDVLFWPDNDKPGRDYAMKAAQAILKAGAASVAILVPPTDKPENWDAADAVTEGFDIAGFLVAGERIPVVQSDEDTLPPGLFDGIDWMTEAGLATAFTRHYGQDWRYCALWGKWLVWTGVRWNEDRVLYAHHLARGICHAASDKTENVRLRCKLASSGSISAVEKIARSDPKHASTADEWDTDLWALNTPGGVIDLRTGQMRAHRREDQMTKVITATPQGDCPTWRAFLADVTAGDAEMIAYLQRMAGYALTGSTQEHALFFLYGTGANGKSVFVRTLASIFGDYATNAPMDTFMETRSDRHPTDMAGLRGARLVTSIETEEGRRWAESKLKALTGGDKISARFMRQDFFEFYPQFKLVIAGNHKPAIRSIDEAMKRRLHLIPFTVTIPPERRDKHLMDKLLAERDGILAWAVEGCCLWQQGGLKSPASVEEATMEYFDEEDSIGEFLEQEAQRLAQARVAVAQVFQRWQEWATRRGEYVGTSRWLAQQLANRGFARTRIHGGVKALAGLSLKPKDYGNCLPYPDN